MAATCAKSDTQGGTAVIDAKVQQGSSGGELGNKNLYVSVNGAWEGHAYVPHKMKIELINL